jgi:hypothetical protein
MAKIFRTETLNLNGNIRLDSSTSDAFEIKNVAGSTLMSRSSIESDISSLQAADVKNESDLSVDVSSLASIDSGHDTDISSLAAVSSAGTSDLDVDISSLAADISTNDVVAISQAINGTENSPISEVTVTFGRTFASAPKVIGIMKAGSSSPIIACQLSSISTTEAVFQLSDDIVTSNDYTLEVLASV